LGVVFAAIAAVTLSCSSDDPTRPTRRVGNLAAWSGDDQTGPAGGSLPLPIAVRATDADGQPVRGVDIFYTVFGGAISGDPDPAMSTTNADGIAATTWHFGTQAGEKTVDACTNGFIQPVHCVTLSATATP